MAKKLNKKILTLSTYLSLAIGYTWLVVAIDLAGLFEPENLDELLAIYVCLSIPLIVLAFLATFTQFSSSVKNAETRSKAVICIILAAAYFFILSSVVVFAFIRLVDSTSSVEVANFKNYR